MDDDDIYFELERVFMPYTYERRERVRRQGARFVHYTSAENLTKIIQSKNIWMRNARCMNDYMELSHGYEQLLSIFNNNDNKRAYFETLEPFGEGLGAKILTQFNQWWQNIHQNTYISSISEHDASEDILGRLSMWRAYGRVTGKSAMVMNLPLTPGAAKGLRIFASPVAYFTYQQVEQDFHDTLDSIKINSEFLKTVAPEKLRSIAFSMLMMACICLKHKGFEEEREWRIIYLPFISPSEHMIKSVETVDGIPQTVYKIPLVNNPKKNITGIDIPTILDRIIVGPSVYPAVMRDAFIDLLREVGVEDAQKKVFVSDIPLRT